MANIQEYIEQIQSAIYGEEVRGSIINAITAMNSESSSAKNSATAAEESARASANSAKTSETKATNAQKDVTKFNNMTVSAQKLAAGQNPTASISDDGTKKHLTLGIPKGDIGVTPNISLTVSTGAAGSEAAVTKSGTATNPTFAFTIPRGDIGQRGPIGNTPNITVKANTGDAGSNVSVSKGGTNENPVFTFTIPRGNTGAIPEISAKVVNSETGTNADVVVSGTSENPVLTFTIPRGYKGDKGDKGDPGPMPEIRMGTVTTGAPGSKAEATFTGTAESPVLNLTIPEGQRGVTEGVPLTDIPAKDLGTEASAGASNEVARSDHIHKKPSGIQKDLGAMTISWEASGYTDPNDPSIFWRGIRAINVTEKKNEVQIAVNQEGAVVTRVYDSNGQWKTKKQISSINGRTAEETGNITLEPTIISAVSFSSQALTDDQKQQARTNIGAGTSNFSGSYNDLTDKPTIPTNVSELQNDSGYLTTAPVTSVNGLTGDVTIEASAGGPSLSNTTPANLSSAASAGSSSEAARADHAHLLPTPTEVSAVSFSSQALTDDQKQQARTNIGAGTSNFSGSYNDLTDKPTIPTNVSELQNDSGYLTTAPVTSVNGLTGDVEIANVGGSNIEVIYETKRSITIGETNLVLQKDPTGAKYLLFWFTDTRPPCIINAPSSGQTSFGNMVPYSHFDDNGSGTETNPCGFRVFDIAFNSADTLNTFKITKCIDSWYLPQIKAWDVEAQTKMMVYKIIAVY